MRRLLSIIAGTLTIALMSASIAFAGGGVSGVATGHGQAVKDVAQAVDYVSGKARGEAVSALAKTHGAIVAAAAKAQGAANAAAGKANSSNGREPGGLKGAGS